MLGTVASWVQIVEGIALLALPVLAWFLRNMKQSIANDIVPKLTNGDTSVASYARQTRDIANKALELATTTDARMGRVETKVDSLILRDGNGTLASGS